MVSGTRLIYGGFVPSLPSSSQFVLFPKCSGVKDKEQSGYLSFWNQVVRLFVIPCDCQTKGVKKSVLVEISDDKAILGVGLPQH